MLPNALSFIDENRPKTVFLPGISFGYLYAEHPGPSYWAELVPILNSGGDDFLWLSLGSLAVACFYYALADTGPGNAPNELLYAVVTTQFLFLIGSAFELYLYTAEDDIVVVGLFLLTFVLISLALFERIIIEVL